MGAAESQQIPGKEQRLRFAASVQPLGTAGEERQAPGEAGPGHWYSQSLGKSVFKKPKSQGLGIVTYGKKKKKK